MTERRLGRGEIATTDMKARIAALQANGLNSVQILSVLWDRCMSAEQGAGYQYEYAEADPVRPARERRQPARR
jgi:hypothetical protein